MATGGGQPAPSRAAGTKVVDLRPVSKPVLTVKFIVLEKGPTQMVVSQEDSKKVEVPICVVLVADETACCYLQLYGKAEVDYVNVRDIVRLSQGMFTYYKDMLVLKAGRRWQALHLCLKDHRLGFLEKMGEFNMVFSETVNMSSIAFVKDDNGGMVPAEKLPTTVWWPPAQ